MPVDLLLGQRDYTRIRKEKKLIIGCAPSFPVVEETKMGNVLSLGSTEVPRQGSETYGKSFLISSHEATGDEQFQQLCSLDVLGLQEPEGEMTGFNHEQFKQQITLKDGHYSTRLPWRATIASNLPDNKAQALQRLGSTTRKLEKLGKLQDYDKIMREQLAEGMLEEAPTIATGSVVHVIPHSGVFRAESKTTPLRIVFDASAKSNSSLPSLNDCLEKGPNLLPKIFEILIRNRFRRFIITGDLAKAFHMIHVDPVDRDAQRILWYNNLKERKVKEYRFSRIIFGSTSSPYILNATLEKHLQDFQDDPKYAATVKALQQDTYVDDVSGGGNTQESVKLFKDQATELLKPGGFKLYKWNSNLSEVDESDDKVVKFLGTAWDKSADTFSVTVDTTEPTTLTKRKLLAYINGTFDVLGWAGPWTITAKLIFAQVCEKRTTWDEALPSSISKQWKQFVQALKALGPTVTVPRAVCSQGGVSFSLHGFSDASAQGICAAIYVVEWAEDVPTGQKLLTAKSRIAPKGQTIPRLELVACHVLAKLMYNVSTALDVPIQDFYYYTDSATALHWLKNQGNYRVYVKNRVKAINEMSLGSWSHVITSENPADLGTRPKSPSEIPELWFQGPPWLTQQELRPPQPLMLESTPEILEEQIKETKEKVFVTLNEKQSQLDFLCEKYPYWKLVRVTSWVMRFKNNCLLHKQAGPLSAEELMNAEQVCVRQAQQVKVDVPPDIKTLTNNDGLVQVDTRIPGYNPLWLPKRSAFTTRLIEHHHLKTLHGGVQTTMASIRSKFWVTQLRSQAKTLIYRCNLCKRDRVKRLQAPPTSNLPVCRTEFSRPWAVIGCDYAGPIYYKVPETTPKPLKKGQKITWVVEKIYIILFTCALTRSVHLGLCKGLSAQEFQFALKEFVTRRDQPDLIISDNASTFEATEQWLKTLKTDDELNDYLGRLSIKWKFNLARAPWWGGFFERLIGIMKRSLSKQVGKALLTYDELKDALLDVETFMNNRPLTYMEEGIDKPVLSPNLLIKGNSTPFLEEDLEKLDYLDEEKPLKKRLAYLLKTKSMLKRLWFKEYLFALRDQRNKEKFQKIPKIGEVVLNTEGLDGLKPQWNLSRVMGHITGKDGIVRGLKLKNKTGYNIERPLQLVRNLELTEHGNVPEPSTELKESEEAEDSIKGLENTGRPRRKAAEAARDYLIAHEANEREGIF